MHSLMINTWFSVVGIAILFLCTQQVDSIKLVINRVNNSPDVFGFYSNCTANTCQSKNASIHKSGNGVCYCRCQQNSPNFVAQVDFAGSSCNTGSNVKTIYAKCSHQLSNPPELSSALVFLDLSKPGSLNTTWTSSLPKPVCLVMTGRVQYLDKGMWFNANAGNTTVFTVDNNVFKWSGVDYPVYAGRIVSIQFTCNSKTYCVMFKVQGNLTYILSDQFQTISPSPSIQPPSTIPQFSIAVSPTKEIPVNRTNITPSTTAVAIVTSSAMVIPIGSTTSNEKTRCSRGTGVFCDWLYLGLSVGGGTVFIVFVAGLVWLACKRKRRKVSNSNQKTPALFDSELPAKNCDNDTELMVLVGEKRKPNTNRTFSTSGPEHGSDDDIQKDEKRNTYYRPLKLVESEMRPIIPPSLQRISSISSEDDYTDNDSRQLIQPHSSKPSQKQKHSLTAKDAVLELDNEEDTYEVMDSKTIAQKREGHNKMTGIENQSFESDKKLSIYETVDEYRNSAHSDRQTSWTPDTDGFDEQQPNYEAMESGVSDEQPNYEAMESEFHEEQPNYEAMESEFHEEQPNYEAMETEFHKEQPNYEAMESKMSVHPNYSDFSEEQPNYEAMEDHIDKVYDLPVIVDEEATETDYEIPPISKEFQEQHSRDLNRLTLPVDHSDDDVKYSYVSNPESQARELTEKFKGRKSWHSGEQPPKTRVSNLSGTKTFWDPKVARQSSQEKNAHDGDELYSVADHPKPRPDLLRFTPTHQRKAVAQSGQKHSNTSRSPENNSTKSRQSVENIITTPRKSTDFPQSKNNSKSVGSRKSTTATPFNNTMASPEESSLAGRPMPGSPRDRKSIQPRSYENINTSRNSSPKVPRKRDSSSIESASPSSRETSPSQPLYANLAEMLNDVTSESKPVDFEVTDDEAFYGNMVNDQPLYENFSAMADHN